MQPLVSIIIPTYNRAHLIEETLDSISDQTYTNWECIIVDDGSTDTTLSILKKYAKQDSRFKFYQRENSKIKGPNSCRNIGFERSSGTYVNFFDSDDLYNLQALEKILSAFTDEIDVVISKVERVSLETGDHVSYNTIQSSNIIKDYFVGTITYYVCGPMWKRSFLERQEVLFDEAIGNLDDWDFNLRMLYQEPKKKLIETAYIQYRIHPNSFSKELKKLNLKEIKSDINAREKHLRLLKHTKFQLDYFQAYTITRIRFFYKTAMRKKQPGSVFLLKKLLKHQIQAKKPILALRTAFIHFFYKLTGKGDKLLK